MTCQVPVLYATAEGQTRRIAFRLAGMFREHGLASRAIDLTDVAATGIPTPRLLLLAGLRIRATAR